MKTFETEAGRVLMGRLERGDDVLGALTGLCKQKGITAGAVWAIGAVERGGVGYYDQKEGRYLENRFDSGMEIVALQGNVSEKNGEVFLHCHVVLADREGRCFGGHLLEGNLAFACEFTIAEFRGIALNRTEDPATGLMLW
jgi:predicted DNA-binding protein with PD1-like motif